MFVPLTSSSSSRVRFTTRPLAVLTRSGLCSTSIDLHGYPAPCGRLFCAPEETCSARPSFRSAAIEARTETTSNHSGNERDFQISARESSYPNAYYTLQIGRRIGEFAWALMLTFHACLRPDWTTGADAIDRSTRPLLSSESPQQASTCMSLPILAHQRVHPKFPNKTSPGSTGSNNPRCSTRRLTFRRAGPMRCPRPGHLIPTTLYSNRASTCGSAPCFNPCVLGTSSDPEPTRAVPMRYVSIYVKTVAVATLFKDSMCDGICASPRPEDPWRVLFDFDLGEASSGDMYGSHTEG